MRCAGSRVTLAHPFNLEVTVGGLHWCLDGTLYLSTRILPSTLAERLRQVNPGACCAWQCITSPVWYVPASSSPVLCGIWRVHYYSVCYGNYPLALTTARGPQLTLIKNCTRIRVTDFYVYSLEALLRLNCPFEISWRFRHKRSALRRALSGRALRHYCEKEQLCYYIHHARRTCSSARYLGLK